MPHYYSLIRPLLLLGGLTTFSSFSAEVVGLLAQQRYGLALCTAALHVFGSLLLTVAGMRTVLVLMVGRG